MRIRSIAIRNFRKLVEPVAITNLTNGITVIAGDNEEGKSTVLIALRAAFCQKYNAGGKTAAALQPYNSAVRPEVAVEFEIDGRTFELHKAFCQKPSAELKTPDGRFQGPEAEEKLAELCGFSTKDKLRATGDPASPTIWGLLWVPQATAIAGLDIGEQGRQTIDIALESEIGNIFGGDEGRTLLKRIGARYLEWFTESRGGPKGEYKAAADQLTNVEKEYEEYKQRYDEYTDKIDELTTKRECLATHERDRTLEVAEGSLKTAQDAANKIHGQKAELQSLQQTERAEQLELQSREETWQARVKVINELVSVEETLASVAATETNLKAQFDKLDTTCTEAQQADKITQDELNAAETAVRNAELIDQICRVVQLRDETAAHRQAARTAQHEATKALKDIESIKIDLNLVSTLRNLERTALTEEAKLASAATSIRFAPSGNKRVSIDNDEIPTDKELSVTKGTTLSLEDWGQVTVTPGGEDLDLRQRAARTARALFDTALQAAGVATLMEAEELSAKRSIRQTEYEVFNKEIKMHAPSGLPNLDEEVAMLDSRLAGLLVAGEQPPDSSLSAETAAYCVTQAKSNRDAAVTKKVDAGNQLAQANTASQQVSAELQALTGKRDVLHSQRDTLRGQIEVDRAKASDESVQEEITLFKTRLAKAHERTEVARAAFEAMDPEALAQRLIECERHCERVRDEIAQLRQDIRELSGELKAYGRDGLYEKLHALEGSREMAAELYMRIHKEAQALKVLYEILRESEQEVKQQVLRPILMRLEPYLQLLFPDAEIQFDREAFEIMNLKRGNLSEPYADLSIGTREQLSILTRLAVAEMLSDQGRPAVVILDDALVYSDPSRFDRMLVALQKAAQKVQTIILTCREGDYEKLGVQTIRLAECNDPTGAMFGKQSL